MSGRVAIAVAIAVAAAAGGAAPRAAAQDPPAWSVAATVAGDAATARVTMAAGPAVAHPTPVRPLPASGGPLALHGRPPGRRMSSPEVIGAARAAPEVRRALERHAGAEPQVTLLAPPRWRVVFATGRGAIAEATVDDRDGRVTETWTGIQARWPMARGQRGAFGRAATALGVWVPLLVAFLLPFLRPPWRLVHLDLAVLAALSVSVACFSHGLVRLSVPLAYPPLAYLLVRSLAIARRRRRGRPPPPPVRLRLTAGWLGTGAVFLLGVRLGLQLTSSNVIDVGYAGVIGADRIAHGGPLYGGFPAANAHGDTYGPLNYLAYVPFELALPWHGAWDELPAAHAAAATFDLACVVLLAALGRRAGGPRLAVLLAYLWLACPFTLMAANSGANDPLVGALVLLAAALAASPAGRGAALAAAGLVKFAPLALIPLFARHPPPGRGVRTVAAAGATMAAGVALVLALDGTLATFADRTVGFQLGRRSPFSVWGLYDLPALQHVAQGATLVLALALARASLREDLVWLSAATAAVLLALQLTASHWFFLYLPWLLGPLLLALVAPYMPAPASGRSTGSIDLARPGSSQRTSTALSHGSSVAAS